MKKKTNKNKFNYIFKSNTVYLTDKRTKKWQYNVINQVGTQM